MKIASSSLTLDATHQATRSDKRSERLFPWVGDRRPPDPAESPAAEVARAAARAPAPASTLRPSESGAHHARPRPGETSFAELARHDDDGNGWIDATDAAYRLLALWSPASGDAPSALVMLARAGVGAIYLGNVATPFMVKSDGTAAAEVAKTGIFPREDGTPGTVHHVDLLV